MCITNINYDNNTVTTHVFKTERDDRIWRRSSLEVDFGRLSLDYPNTNEKIPDRVSIICGSKLFLLVDVRRKQSEQSIRIKMLCLNLETMFWEECSSVNSSHMLQRNDRVFGSVATCLIAKDSDCFVICTNINDGTDSNPLLEYNSRTHSVTQMYHSFHTIIHPETCVSVSANTLFLTLNKSNVNSFIINLRQFWNLSFLLHCNLLVT